MTNEEGKVCEGDSEEALTPEIKTMLDQRIERAEVHPNEGIPLEEVLAKARARWKK